MAISIVLADDHHIIREGLRVLLDAQTRFRVIGEAADGRSAVKMIIDRKPDVAVMDVSMPSLNGIEATRQIVAGSTKTKIIALSMYADRRYIDGMLKAGASGYLLKNCVTKELVTAINTVVKGNVYLSPQIATTVVNHYLCQTASSPGIASDELTDREREVLQLIAEGLSIKDIAETLHIGKKTAESHRRNIMQKTGIHSIAGLTQLAIREGLIQL
jgi:DNA-binding NarL/FixJ family response regulator